MRNRRVGVGAGLVLGAVALSVPLAFAAVAAGDSDIRIEPGSATPGSTVTVTIKGCGDDVTYGKGQSEVAGMFHLFEGSEEGELTGEFEIPEGTDAANDTVIAKCPPATRLTDTYEIGETDTDRNADADKQSDSGSDSDSDSDSGSDSGSRSGSESRSDSDSDDRSDSDSDSRSKSGSGSDSDSDTDSDTDSDDRPNGSVDAGGGGMADQGMQLGLGSVVIAGAAGCLVRRRRVSGLRF
ncbi:hypothetical protein [Streptomyces sp. NPDC002133]|uniref:hypothetical protein n=1 Tax=Streptomyces sp. NPDC002133 TaxID=3154409 RepID=UPI003330E48C